MDIRFQPNHDLRESVDALRSVGDNAVLCINPEYIRIYSETDDMTGTLIIPKTYFMSYSGTDCHKISLRKFKEFLKPAAIINLKDLKTDLILDYVQKPEPVYSASAKMEVTQFSGFEEQNTFEIQSVFKINNKRVSTVKVNNIGGFFSKKLVRAHFNGKRLSMIVSHVSRYCTVSFDADKPLKLRYELSGMSLYFTLNPLIPGVN